MSKHPGPARVRPPGGGIVAAAHGTLLLRPVLGPSAGSSQLFAGPMSPRTPSGPPPRWPRRAAAGVGVWGRPLGRGT